MARPGPSRGQLHVGRYFLTLLLLFAALYAAVIFAGKGGAWLKPKLGLDLRGGAQVTLTPKSANGKPPSQDQLSSAVAILRQRVDANGVSEAEIAIQGNTIEISVPGGNRASIDKVTQAAQMEFRRVVACQSIQAGNGCTALPVTQYPQQLLQTATPSATPKASTTPSSASIVTPKPSSTTNKRPISAALAPSPSPTPTPTPTPSSSAAPEMLSGIAYTAASYDALNCGDPKVRAGGAIPIPSKEIVACDKDGYTKYHLEAAKVYGKDIKGANVTVDPQSGTVQV
ncbi:MAG: preprotein translocase subunit SecD, partial [Frankiales bacterium]|nr:preprotein translocase subunit SecD [Frankiales bacterium]